MEKLKLSPENPDIGHQRAVLLSLPLVMDARLMSNETILQFMQRVGKLHPMVAVGYTERPKPELLERAEVYRNLFCGICGSDKKAVQLALSPSNVFEIPTVSKASPTDLPFYSRFLEKFLKLNPEEARYTLPTVLGHEGVVINKDGVVGAFYSPNWCIKLGEDQEKWCESCRSGWENHCQNDMQGPVVGRAGGYYAFIVDENRNIIGHYGGSMAEEMIGYKENFFPLPENVTPEVATLTDPLACAFNGFEMADGETLEKDIPILIIGGGTMGWASYQILYSRGFTNVTVLTKYKSQAKLVEEYGYETVLLNDFDYRKQLGGKKGYPVVIEAVGKAESINDALNMCSPQGKAIMLGLGQQMEVDLNIPGSRGLTMLFPFWANRRQFSQAIKELQVIPESVKNRLVKVHNAPRTRRDILVAFFPHDQGQFLKHAFRFHE